MAESKKKKKAEAPAKESKGDKADILKAVAELPKASNLVVDNKRYETVKRDDVIDLLKKML